MQFLDGHSERIYHLGFTPDGSRLLVAGGTPEVAVWRFPEGTPAATFEPEARAGLHLEISPDGRWLGLLTARRDQKTARIVDLTTYSIAASIDSGFVRDGQSVGSKGVRFSKDGTQLDIVGSRHPLLHPRDSGHLIFHIRWDIERGEAVTQTVNEMDEGVDIESQWEIDPSRKSVAIVGEKKLLFWSLENQRIEFELACASTAYPRFPLFSTDDRRLAFATRRSVELFDIPNRKKLVSFKNPTTKFIQSMAFSPDGQTLATVSNDTFVRFWETDTGREVKTYAWEMGQLKAVTIAPDGMRAAAAGKKGKIVVWDLD